MRGFSCADARGSGAFQCFKAGWKLQITMIYITESQKGSANPPFYCYLSATEKIHGEKTQGKSLFIFNICKKGIITCEQEIMTGE